MNKRTAPIPTRSTGQKGFPIWIQQHLEQVLVGLVALAGLFLVLVNTRLGAFWSDDTYYYILPARQFMRGEGFHPSYIFGPVLPFVLSIISLFKIDPLLSIRWLNAILFLINILLTADITHRITRARWLSLIIVLIVVTADVIIEIHGWAMSEALAITLSLLALDLMLMYFGNNRWGYLVLAALSTALAVLTRFASLSLIPAISLTILLFDPAKRILVRLRNSILFGLASLTPFLLYLLRNTVINGSPLRYQHFINVPFDQSQLVWFLYNWFSLFLPGRILRGREVLVAAVISVVTTLCIAAFSWHANRKGYRPLHSVIVGLVLLGSSVALSILTLYIARGFTELTVFNLRYLIPPYLLTLILMIVIAGQIWQSTNRIFRYGLLVVFSILIVYYGFRTFDFTQHTSRTGLGYSNIGWHQSETIKYINEHPDLIDMVSTGEMGIFFWTGRMPTVLAAFPNPSTLETYLCQHSAPLFLMGQMPPELYGMNRDDAVKGLTLVHQFNDSSMYRCPTP